MSMLWDNVGVMGHLDTSFAKDVDQAMERAQGNLNLASGTIVFACGSAGLSLQFWPTDEQKIDVPNLRSGIR
jgi:hypothetical protein